MARNISEIEQIILDEKSKYAELDGLTSTSKTAIWRLFVYIVAFVAWSVEIIFDKHRSDTNAALSEKKPHGARWYRNKALAFQYGFDLLPDDDLFDNTGYTAEQIEASKIVKYAAVTEAETESRIIIKIATESNEVLQPITAGQKQSFEAYIKEVKDFGVNVTVINYLPDRLIFNLEIYRDPLVLDANGTSILTGKKPVEDAIKEYMKELPFNGEFVKEHFRDKLQKVPGVVVPEIKEMKSAWIDESSNQYGSAQPIQIRTIPISGYFEFSLTDSNFLSRITYVV